MVLAAGDAVTVLLHRLERVGAGGVDICTRWCGGEQISGGLHAGARPLSGKVILSKYPSIHF